MKHNTLPCGDRLLVVLRDNKAPDGIIMLEGAEQVEPYGLVLAVGPKVTLFAPGDKIILNLQYAQPYKKDDLSFFVSEGSVYAKLEEVEDFAPVVLN